MLELFDLLDLITISLESQILAFIAVGIFIGFFSLDFSECLKRARNNKETTLDLLNDLHSKKEAKELNIYKGNYKWVKNSPSMLSDGFFSLLIGLQAFSTFVLSVHAGFNGEMSKFLGGIFISILLIIASKYFFVRTTEVYDALKNDNS